MATAAAESSGPRGAAVVVEETPVGAPRAPRQRVSGLGAVAAVVVEESPAAAPRAPQRRVSGLGAVAAVEVLLLALGVLAVSVLGAGGPADRPSDVAHVTVPSPTVAGTEATRPEASGSASPGAGGTLAACRRMAEQQDVALGAAAVTLDDWQIHLGAMNKFAAGVVTVDELEGFWEQTEVQAAAGSAPSAPQPGTWTGRPHCPPPGKRMRTAALKNCAEDVESRRRALRAARIAADEWDRQQQRCGACAPGRPPRPRPGPAGCDPGDEHRRARGLPAGRPRGADRTACSS